MKNLKRVRFIMYCDGCPDPCILLNMVDDEDFLPPECGNPTEKWYFLEVEHKSYQTARAIRDMVESHEDEGRVFVDRTFEVVE